MRLRPHQKRSQEVCSTEVHSHRRRRRGRCRAVQRERAARAEPGPPKNIADTASEAANFKTFTRALTEAGLIDKLKEPGPFTVFAPTDEAFAKLPAGTVDSMAPEQGGAHQDPDLPRRPRQGDGQGI